MTRSPLDAMRQHSREEFQTWLANEVEVREELEPLVGQALGIDIESLGPLEAFALGRWRKPDDALQLAERAVLDAVARHVGLVLLLAVDGAWDIELVDADDAYFELPVVVLPDESHECPLSLVLAALDRRTGAYLQGVVGNLAEDVGDDEA
jgi:hypothetical protein